jgi:hypothetical protein
VWYQGCIVGKKQIFQALPQLYVQFGRECHAALLELTLRQTDKHLLPLKPVLGSVPGRHALECRLRQLGRHLKAELFFAYICHLTLIYSILIWLYSRIFETDS